MSTLNQQLIHNLRSLNKSIPAELIAEMLKLDQVKIGFVLTRNQFDSITTLVMEKQAKICPGMWSNFFYPLSGHVVFELDWPGRLVYPLLALSTNFSYYKWIYGPRFPIDWVKFSDMIKETDCNYILFKEEEGHGMFYSVDSVSGEIYQLSMFVGGGRMYHQPSAHPCGISPYDEVIKPVVTGRKN